MSNFNNKSITNKGLELLSAAISGGTLEFTRVVMGDGTYDGDIGLIESLVSQKQSLDIKSITRKGSQVVLSTTLLQSAITEDFYWKEIGVYAKGADNVEVLYMYGSATDASFISKDMLNEKMINVGVLVSNAQNVTATIDGSLVYLSQDDLEAHNLDVNAHEDIRIWVRELLGSGDWSTYSQAEDIQERIGSTTDDSSKNTLFGFLSNLKSKIDTFVSQYTSSRATKLDHLDVDISSRAPASTALSNATWTAARAAKIDTINTNSATNNTASKTGVLSQKLAYIIDSLIGATNATGGSSTAGTVMAKLNKLINTSNGDLMGTVASSIIVDKAASAATKTTIYSCTGKGIMKIYFLFRKSGSERYGAPASIVVDGTEIVSDINELLPYAYSGSSSNNTKYFPVPIEIPFNKSLFIYGTYEYETTYVLRGMLYLLQ